MDVRLFAFLARQPSAALQDSPNFMGLPKRGLALVLANAMFWQPLLVQADGIVVSAPGTTLDQAANGVPIVNIAAPNGSGLSHNQFKDYNVGANGVILNNSTNNMQNTQLGGYIVGNGNLNGRSASVIINEVNGGSPSQLMGYTEVAGPSAHVIVANPYGITCNGCGFINTPQATLTTGKAVIENGQVSRYQVDQGSVSIEGTGLNANNIDRFEIIARSVRLNAQIQAQNLMIIAGTNDVDAQTLNTTARTADPSTAPQLAIDSSVLGGMYAGAIKLVSTEAGVGVNMAGDMVVSADDLQLDTNGRLTLARTEAAQGDVKVNAREVALTEAVYAGRDARIVAASTLDIDKNLTAAGNVHVAGQQIVNRGNLNAGLKSDGSLNNASHLQIQGGSLVNQGKIAAQGTLSTDLKHLDNRNAELVVSESSTLKSDTFDNRGGKLIGQQALTLQGTGLSNGGGTIASNQALSVTLGETLDNSTDGLILSKANGLTLSAKTIDNRAGTLQANTGELKATAIEVFDNTDGKVLTGSGAMTLVADELRNQKGQLNAQGGKLTSTTSTFDNTQGDIRADTAEVTTTKSLNNDRGHLAATVGNLALKRGEIHNEAGNIVARQQLTVDADSLSNRKGSFGGESIGLTLRGKLDNDDGLIESLQTLNLDSSSLTNFNGKLRALGSTDSSQFNIGGQFNNDHGLVEIGNERFGLDSAGLSNQQGVIRHLGTQGFALSLADTGSAGGSFITNSELNLDVADWSNTSLIQAQKISLKVGSFVQTVSGKLISVEGVEASGNNWVNDGSLETQGDLTLNLSGTYQGSGSLKSLRSMTLSASSADLGTAAQIRSGGTASFNLGSQLLNLGSLTATGGLLLQVGSLINQGTVGSGQALRIETTTLFNDAGLIFSGADMAFQANSVTNKKGDIYSLGRLDISDANSQPASLIENISATIESAHGMQLLANRLINRKEKLNFISTLTSGDIVLTGTDNCKGNHCEASYEVSEVYGTKVTDDSARANLVSGGELVFKGDSFDNRFSSVSARGDITLDSKNLNNLGAGGGEQRHYSYYVYTSDDNAYYTFVNNIAPFNNYNNPASASYNPAAMPLASIAIGTLRGYSEVLTSSPVEGSAAIIESTGKVNITGTEEGVNGIIRPGESLTAGSSRVGSTSVDSSVQVPAQLNAQLAPDLAQKAINPLTLPGFSFPEGPNGLFQFSGDPQHKYLIETNPALTSVTGFVNSDYLLDRIGVDPDLTQRRLGDGLYEQRLIREAVAARTGQRFIAGLDSDEAMFRYLMDNAIASKEQLSLSVGVALNSQQVAALTHDIVWMEEQVVNGEKVLVPVLYLAQANNRLGPTGALIAGNDVTLTAGKNLDNVGTLRATNNLSATAGNNLTNGGLIEAGNRLDLLAGNDLTNKAGGILYGRDVTLAATLGDVTNERTVVRRDSVVGNVTWRQDFADSAARVESANDLTIKAGRDVQNIGGSLQAGRDLSVVAGRDVNINSAQIETVRLKRGNTYSSVQQAGSTVSVGRDLMAISGRDINVVASDIDAKRDIAMAATEDMTISSAADETHSLSRSKKLTVQTDHVKQVSADLNAGGSIALNAGKDLSLIASRITAGEDATLEAGERLNSLAAQDSDYYLYDKKSKGSFGSKATKRDEVTDVRNIGNTITTGGDLLLKSGGDQLYQVAKLDSGNDLTLDSGGAITFEGVKDLHDESHTKSKSSLAWTSMKGKGNTDETLRQTQMVAKGELTIKAVNGLNIDIKQVDQQTVSQTIDAMVQADPQLAWLKEAEKRGDVDWRQVKELHESFKYSHSSLGQGAMLAIMILVTAITAGAASGFVGTVSGAYAGSGSVMAAATTSQALAAGATYVGAGWGNVIATAALTSMAGTAAVSTINNKGNLGVALKDTFSSDSLKGAAVAGLTAGFTASVIDPNLHGTAKQFNSLGKGFDLSKLGDIGGFALNAGAQGLASGVINTAINGGSLGDNLANGLVSQAGNVAAAVGFYQIGSIADANYREAFIKSDAQGMALWAEGGMGRTALHALMGGAISSATGGDFTTGAVAAGASQAMAGVLNESLKDFPQLREAAAKIVGMTAAGLAGRDVEKAAWVSGMADQYNRQLHPNEIPLIEKQAESFAKEANISPAEAEKRLAQALLYYADQDWNGVLTNRGVAPDALTLKHLGIALSPLGATYAPAGTDVPTVGVEKNYAPDEVVALITNYRNTHAAEYANPEINMINLQGGFLGDPTYAYADFYRKNLASPFDLSNAISGGAVGTAQGVGNAVSDTATSVWALLKNPAGISEQVANGLIGLSKNPLGSFLSIAEASQTQEAMAILYDMQGNSQASAAIRAQSATEFALNFIPANRAKAVAELSLGRKLGFDGPCCFAAGTMVSTPDGDRAIDTLKVGDIVWSKPEKGGKPFAAAILATHVRTDQPIYRLKLKSVREDGQAENETLLVTPGHPFYVPAQRDFVPVIDLKPGDRLQSLEDGASENTSSEVESLELYLPEGKTYNLTVDVGHTFYVGKLKTWVHNTGPCELPEGYFGENVNAGGAKATGTAAEAAIQVPGRVQSRVNLMTGDKSAGWEHVVSRHFNPEVNASQFTIGQAELRTLLQSKAVVSTPVTRTLESAQGIRYVREVNLSRPIGIDKFSGQPTSTMTVLTDRFGNLITTTPGIIK